MAPGHPPLVAAGLAVKGGGHGETERAMDLLTAPRRQLRRSSPLECSLARAANNPPLLKPKTGRTVIPGGNPIACFLALVVRLWSSVLREREEPEREVPGAGATVGWCSQSRRQLLSWSAVQVDVSSLCFSLPVCISPAESPRDHTKQLLRPELRARTPQEGQRIGSPSRPPAVVACSAYELCLRSAHTHEAVAAEGAL